MEKCYRCKSTIYKNYLKEYDGKEFCCNYCAREYAAELGRKNRRGA